MRLHMHHADITNGLMESNPIFDVLVQANARPLPYEKYTAKELWTGPHTSKQMLAVHLDLDTDLASRKLSFIQRSLSWMHKRFDIKEGRSIADFGCGPGFYTNAFAHMGAKVTGIDFSTLSLEYARKQAHAEGLTVNYVHQNYLDYENSEGSFDLITMIYCDFCPLSPVQRRRMLDKFHKLIKKGGAVLIDVCSLKTFKQKKEDASYAYRQLNGFWAEGAYYGFQNSFKYEQEKLILDKYTIVEPKRIYEIYNWLQCYSLEMLREEIEASGLRIVEHYSNVAGDEYSEDSTEMAIVAVKA